MKRLSEFLMCLLLLFFVAACGSGNQSGEEGAENEEEVADEGDDEAADSNIGLSTWEGHSAKETPGGEGKWVATIAFGEELTLLNETETDANNKAYEKVKLLDGKEGWVRADFVAKGAELAAVLQDAQIYKRPGISNITDETVLAGSIVVVKGHKDEFSEFIARNDSKNKRQEGWLLGEKALTTDQNEVSAAVLYNKAMAEKVPAKRQEKLKQVAANYPNTAFAKLAQNALDAANAANDLGEDELMITGDNVNVRSGPTANEDNKVFQLNSGDVCKVIERGDMDEIGSKLDYWYKISAKGQTGWVFGTFTSKAL